MVLRTLKVAQRPAMTTMLTYNRMTVIDYDSLEFNPDEPEPLPDGMIQNPVLFEILSILADRFSINSPRADVFLDSNTFICYNPDNLNVRVGPDVYLAFGVDARAIRERRIYLPWEAGKLPDFVLEVASVTTARYDVAGKRRLYAQIGIPEYWRFDPTGGEHYGQPLSGEILFEGEYHPVELTTEPDGALKGFSPALGLYLCPNEDRLTFFDPAMGSYLLNLSQERDARRQAESALRDERAEREAAQIRIRQLEEELRRRQSEG
jgi:Uma2 family endonuclease